MIKNYQLSYISLKYEDCLKLLEDNAFVYFLIENNF